MRAWLPTTLVLPLALAGCPALLSDWAIGGGATDASVDDGGTAETSGLDQKTPNPEASREAGAGHDAVATDDADAGPAPEEAGSSPDSAVDAGLAPDEAGSGASDAQVEADAAPNGCANDLSNILGGDFHIDFEVLGVAGGGPLLEQRSVCDQYSVHWLIAETQSGNIITQFYDGSGGPQLQSVATVNDGALHHVVVARVALTFSITIDGQLDNSVPNAVWSPATLSLLQVGRSACASPFAGQIENVCITRQ